MDAGVILYLVQALGYGAKQVEDLIYRRSGLLGVSDLSSDMRVLTSSPLPAARDAVELFVYRLGRETGALASSLGGVDGVVFTAGIGEHAADIRALACARLAWLGLELDSDANARHAPVISTPTSRVKVRVTPTDEEAMTALHALAVVGSMPTR
jgi:acetate kinase